MSAENSSEKDPSGILEEFFDPSILSELEALADAQKGVDHHAQAPTFATLSSALHDKLADVLASHGGQSHELSEAEFVALTNASLNERTNKLIEICRLGGIPQAVQAVENLIVFFQALVPTIKKDEGSQDIRRLFFRLIPTLIHISFNDFSHQDDVRQEGRLALQNVSSILIEISSVRLAPSERELIFRSIDQMVDFIGVGEYAMSNEIIASQLLGIIARNKLTRALFRLMEVEVSIQCYLKEKLGYRTPQIRIPQDFEVLNDGPIRILHEESAITESSRYFIQIEIPDIPILRNITLHLISQGADNKSFDLRLDSLGTVEIGGIIPEGIYDIGLVYQPEE